MPNGNVTITSSDVPQGFCFVSWSESWQQLVALLSGNLTQEPSWNVGPDTPAPEDQGKPWHRLNADGTPDKDYDFVSGVWVSRHPLPPGAVMMWEGAESDIPTFDGGEVAPVGPFTGPMWERVTQMDAKFPIGPGTTPAAPAGTATLIAVGATGGEELHALTVAELAPHTHTVRAVLANTDGGSSVERLRKMSDTEVSSDQARTDSAGGTITPPSTTPVVEGHNNLPNYRAIWFLRRTGRLDYRL